MPIVVVVETEENYRKWLAGELAWNAEAQALVATNTESTEAPAETLAAL